MQTAVKKRNRYDTSPMHTEQGKLRAIPPFNLTDLQLAVLECFAYDRFLSWDYIAKLIARSGRTQILRILEVMRSEPYAYVQVCEEQQDRSKRHLYQNIKQQYELTKLGREVVFDKFELRLPAWKSTSYIEHHIMGDHFMAGLRIGVKESNGRFRMQPSYELMKSDKMPATTKASKAPFYIPLGDTVTTEKGKVVPHTIRPDREIFTLLDYEKDEAYYFGGLETGTGSETHQPRTPRHDHSYTESKFLDYRSIIEKAVYESHFGFPNFYMIFVERNMGRLEKPFELWHDITADAPWMRQYIWFKTHHLFTETYEASGRAFTEPFYIVGEDGRVVQHSLI